MKALSTWLGNVIIIASLLWFISSVLMHFVSDSSFNWWSFWALSVSSAIYLGCNLWQVIQNLSNSDMYRDEMYSRNKERDDNNN